MICLDEKLFTALRRAAGQRVREFESQELANAAWAFATADRSDGLLFAALSRAVGPRTGKLNAQSLANTA